MHRTWRNWAQTSKSSISIGHRISSKMGGKDRRGTLVEKGRKVTSVGVDLVNSAVSLVHVKASYVSVVWEIICVAVWYWNASVLVFTF